MCCRNLLWDTHIPPDLIRHSQGAVANWSAAAGEDAVCNSIVVAAPHRFSTLKSGSKGPAHRAAHTLSVLDALPLERPADRHYVKNHLAVGAPGHPCRPERPAHPGARPRFGPYDRDGECTGRPRLWAAETVLAGQS